MGDIYESKIPTKCDLDCEDGLYYASEITGNACCPFVFSCYCSRGSKHRKYPAWHPVRHTRIYKKYEFSTSKEVTTPRTQGEVSITPSSPDLRDNERITIPEVLIPHFETGDFISENWELHKETYGRVKLAAWYRAWKASRAPGQGVTR